MHFYAIYHPILFVHHSVMIKNQTEIAALGLIAWTVALLFTLICYRTSVVVFTEKLANSFSPSGNDLTAFGERLTRSYLNASEFVPLILGILLYAIATGQTNVTDDLAVYILISRMAHSSLHMLSTSLTAVGVRSILLWLQIGISTIWVLRLAYSNI